MLEKNSQIFMVAAVAMGLVLGFGSTRIFSLSSDTSPSAAGVPSSDPSQLAESPPAGSRIPLELLQNAVFSEWLGEVEGEITEKNEDSFTLTNQNDGLVVQYREGATVFEKAEAVGELSKGEFQRVLVDFKDIPLGTVVRGPVRFSQDGFATSVVGISMVIQVAQTPMSP